MGCKAQISPWWPGLATTLPTWANSCRRSRHSRPTQGTRPSRRRLTPADAGCRSEVDHETPADSGAELAVAIGREGKRCTEFDAMRCPYTAAMAARRLHQMRVGVPPIQSARTAPSASRVQARVPGAESAAHGYTGSGARPQVEWIRLKRRQDAPRGAAPQWQLKRYGMRWAMLNMTVRKLALSEPQSATAESSPDFCRPHCPHCQAARP